MSFLFSALTDSPKIKKSLLFASSAVLSGIACAGIYELASKNIDHDAPVVPKKLPPRKFSSTFWRTTQSVPLSVYFQEPFQSIPEFPRQRIEEEIQTSDLFTPFVHETNNFYFADILFTSKLDYSFNRKVRDFAFLVYVHPKSEKRDFYSIPEEELNIFSKLLFVNKHSLLYLPFENKNLEDETEYFDESEKPPIACLFTPETGRILVRDVESFLEFVYRRARVRWFEWVKQDESRSKRLLSVLKSVSPLNEPISCVEDVFHKSSKLLKFAQEAHLLVDTPGNLSFRVSPFSNYFLVTPSSVDKTLICSHHFVLGRINFKQNSFDYWSDISKPSVDAGCQAYLYAKCKNIVSFFHFHYQKYLLVYPVGRTDFNYPCGSLEEPREIISILKKNENDSFCIDMVYHGYLVGLTKRDYDKIFIIWENFVVKAIMVRHKIEYTPKNSSKMKKQLYPIFFNYNIGGGLLRKIKNNLVIIYLLKNYINKVHQIRKEIEFRGLCVGKIILI